MSLLKYLKLKTVALEICSSILIELYRKYLVIVKHNTTTSVTVDNMKIIVNWILLTKLFASPHVWAR